MRDTVDTEVKQVRIFAMDALPVAKLAFPPVNTAFRERFGWAKAEVTEDGDIQLGAGHYPRPDAEDAVVIKGLRLNYRRMILAVAGESAAANRAHAAIVEFFAEATGWKPEDPVVVTEETSCVTTLGFDWADLLSPAVAAFAQGPMLAAFSAVAPARAEIRGLGFSFLIGYAGVPERLAAHGVTLADKRLFVEPRVNTPLAERRFFTFSPTDSDTHFQLLAQLERALGAVDRSR